MVRDIPWAESENWLSGNMRDGTLHDIYSNVGGDCKLPLSASVESISHHLGKLIDNIIADHRIQIFKQPDHAQPFFYSFLRCNASGRLGRSLALTTTSLLFNCRRFHRLRPW